MGTYLNPGSERFVGTTNSEIYVDKTEMISFLNKVLKTQCHLVQIQLDVVSIAYPP